MLEKLEKQYAYINELVEATKLGNHEAFETLLRYYRPLLVASVRRCINREPQLITFKDDLETEVRLVVYELTKKFDSSLSYFSYYLLTRLDYWILSRGRRLLNKNTNGRGIEEVSFSDMPHDWEPEDIEDPVGRIANEQVLREALSQLNSKQRDAIDLFFFQAMNQEESAEVLGITQASFSKLLNRALARLRKILRSDSFF